MRHESTVRFTYGHNDTCVGCGVHYADTCSQACPFETRIVDVPFLLRLAAQDLNNYQRWDGGFWIADAIASATWISVEAEHFDEARTAAIEAFRLHLVNLLKWKNTADIVERWGHRSEHATILEELGTAAYEVGDPES
jgi:Fe-S-cluster-containing dehydrogenase component